MAPTDNTVARTLHDLGLAAWFGGSLMGATGVNGAAAVVEDPTQRLRVANSGWARWTPLNLAGIDALVSGHGSLPDKRRERFPQVRSVLVVRHDYLVYERYWHGDTPTTGQEVASVTKSLTSTLIGIALGNHHLKSLDQTVEELLGRHLPAGADPRLAKVTVAQLLTMTGGLARDVPGGGGDPRIIEQVGKPRLGAPHPGPAAGHRSGDQLCLQQRRSPPVVGDRGRHQRPVHPGLGPRQALPPAGHHQRPRIRTGVPNAGSRRHASL
jgi:hypothetical protein